MGLNAASDCLCRCDSTSIMPKRKYRTHVHKENSIMVIT